MATPTGIRAADPGDIAAMRAILAGHGEDEPPIPGHPDVVGPYLRHLVDHHRALVVDEGMGTGEPGGGVVAFGAVLDTGRCRMLSDLFVREDRLGQGLGGRCWRSCSRTSRAARRSRRRTRARCRSTSGRA